MQLIFGIGALWGTRSDVTGIGPDQFGILQDNEVDFSFEVKELYGQLSFPVDIARGKGKVTGKAKMARVFGALYSDIFFGEVAAVGETTVSENEETVLGTGGLYTVANSATFVADLGVFYSGTGQKQFNYATGAPSTGQYSTGTNGIYTFSTSDVGNAIFVSYVYTVAASGKTITINNHFMGYTPTFVGTFYQNRSTQGGSGQLTLRLNECVSSRLTFPSRIDDYGIPDFDWQAFSSGSNVIGTLSTTE